MEVIRLMMCIGANNNEKVTKLLLEYLTETGKEIKKRAEKGEGREIIGDVINRPEDIEIGIDRVGEEILGALVKKYKLKTEIFSEPDGRDIKQGDNPDFYGSIDPFDGSMLYLRGFEHNWYTALSFFDKEKKPICSGVTDILNEKLYISDIKGNFVIDEKTGAKREIFPSRKKDIAEPLVLATYLMSAQYSLKFWPLFDGLVKNLHSKSLVYPQGGSFIYAFLAAGLVDAYVMFDEPRSEIDPGYGFAKRAGCCVVSVNSDGTYEDYQFIPGRQHDKVDLLVAACTPELRDQIVKYYVREYGAKYSFRA